LSLPSRTITPRSLIGHVPEGRKVYGMVSSGFSIILSPDLPIPHGVSLVCYETGDKWYRVPND
jgi:hypothetical protein